MIRVFVVAPTPMMIAGLRAMLTTTEIEVVGAAASFAEINIELELPAIDVIVVDYVLLDEVVRAVRAVRAITNDGRIALVVLTNNDERPLTILRNLSLRGWSLVPVGATSVELQAAVTAVAQGFVVLPVAFSEQFTEQRPAVGTLNLSSSEEALTNREREVLELVSQGLSNKLIARRLQISEHTVKFHISSISTKLGASSRTDAVSRGIRRGLITL
ncbi:MAG: response regulator transcription factor [Chloroflexi bacterium]|nr:MAG: response regulator transcription factor [Chloroflexota bacterium]